MSKNSRRNLFVRQNRPTNDSAQRDADYQKLEPRQLLAADVLSVSNDGVWHQLNEDVATVSVGQNIIKAESFGLFDLQENQLFDRLNAAPLEFTPGFEANAVVLTIPTPDGEFERFAIVEAPVMHPELSAEFPEITTYRGQGIDQPAATIRLDYTVHGFHAQVLSPDGQYYVDPYFHLQTDLYMSYFKQDAIRNPANTAAYSELLLDETGEIIFATGEFEDYQTFSEGNYVLGEDGSVWVQAEQQWFNYGADSFHQHSNGDIHLNSRSEPDAGGCGGCGGAGCPACSSVTEPTQIENDDDDAGNVSELPGGFGFAPDFGTQLRTYETAVAATGEYTQFWGGTVASGQSAIVTAINRVTGIYENDVAVRLELVPNNSSLVYTNGNTDPYSNNNGGAMLSQNQSNVDSVIGNSNYDVGHVFSTGGGGVALLGVIGSTGLKAQGVTGLPSPAGDAFWVDYVAHELGHQFGGNHTFNGDSGSCAGNQRNASTAYEPGSASTIQGYAGICGNDNLQNNSDAMFHSISIDEIRTEVTTGSGGASATITNTGNTVPVVSAGANYVIPDQTPFEITATGSDADGDSLTYSWEQRDLGARRDVNASDNGSSPIFRTFLPSSDPTRVFPRMQDVLDGGLIVGEQYPTTNWNTMDFRVVLRDNASGGGGVVSDDMTVQVVNSGTGFNVTSQSTSTSWTGLETETITWNVSGTDSGSINTPNVDIYFSLDGFTYDILLAEGVPNDGSHDIEVPNVDTTTGRVKVKGAGNIFFDVNTTNISVSSVVVAPGEFGESGQIVGLTDVWQTVNLINTYDNPVVLAGTASYIGPDPVTVRVRNVTSDSFEIQVLEWDYLNQIHLPEDVGYMVIEAGTHTLESGTVIQAGTAIVDENFVGIDYPQQFTSSPVVLTQAMTVNGPNAVGTRLNNVSFANFDVRLQEEQGANQIHVDETLGWVAIEKGPGTDNALTFIADTTNNNVNNNDFTLDYDQTFSSPPIFFAAMQTYNDSDLAVVRSKSIGNSEAVIFLEEEQSADAEVVHANETVGFFAIDAGVLGLNTDGTVGESGVVTNLTHVWQTVNLARTFSNPVVVMGPSSTVGGDPVSIRVRNVTGNSFEVRVAEWDYLNGLHNAAETVGFVVMEEGIHTLADGTIIEAGNVTLDENWLNVNLAGGFGSQPIVLSQPITENGPSAITTRHQNSTSSSFDVRLQEEQGANQIHADETVSWIAVQVASGSDGSFLYDAAFTGDVVTDGDHTITFGQSFGTPPVFLAAGQTYDGADPAWVRYRSVSNPNAVIFLEEEQSADAEISHTSEDVGYFALSSGLIPGVSSFNRPSGFVDTNGKTGLEARDDFSSRDFNNFVSVSDLDFKHRPQLEYGSSLDPNRIDSQSSTPIDGQRLGEIADLMTELELETEVGFEIGISDEKSVDLIEFLAGDLI